MRPEHGENHETAGANETAQERKLNVLLEERLGGSTPPDLSTKILAAAKSEAPSVAPVHDIQAARSARLRKAMGIGAAAASVVIGVGLMLADQWIGSSDSTNPNGNTESVLVGDDNTLHTKQPSSNALAAPSTYNNVLLIEDMTHPQEIGEHTIHMVMGRVLVSPMGLPDKAMLASTAHTYQLNDKEIDQMTNQKNWIVRSGVAMCLLSGGLIFNGEALLAQSVEGERSSHVEGEVDKAFVELLTKSAKTKGKAFEDIDKNDDGFLDQDEYPALKKATNLDSDQDGKVSKNEYAAHMKEMEKALAEINKIFEAMETESVEAAKTFEDLDTNKDGELDGDEYEVTLLKKKDANTDGVVSRDEWDKSKTDNPRFLRLKKGDVTRVEPAKEASKTEEARKRVKSLSQELGKLKEATERLKGARQAVQPRGLENKQLDKPVGEK